tara:strand:+ start:3611 stop:4219 length:609 start_codon:yes stop_codon:yes gene_type:complete
MVRYSGAFDTAFSSVSSGSKATARAVATGAGNFGSSLRAGARNTTRAISRGGKNAASVLSTGAKKAKVAIKKFGTPKKAADDIIKKGTKNSDGLDAKTLAKNDDVIEASKSQSRSLTKMGIQGALGVGALMILTGNKNPITAIKETAEGAADIGEDLGKGIGGLFEGFGEMFAFIGSNGKYVSSSSSCMLLLIILSMTLSTF